MSTGVRNYAYVLAITVIALVVGAVAFLYLLSSYNSNGLDASEITTLALVAINIFTQFSVLLNNKQSKDLRADVANGIDAKLSVASVKANLAADSAEAIEDRQREILAKLELQNKVRDERRGE